MSEETSVKTVKQLADYTKDDIELYYYFWVIPNSTSWYKPLEDNHKKTSSGVSQNKLVSPLSIILLISCLVLGVIGLAGWKCEKKSPNYEQQRSFDISQTYEANFIPASKP
ncbi:MAG: hypothetical protein QNJ64_12590 [Crocosphaera sp.]|nr:hypothetical protein [Crocosphaera sp.]